MKKIKQIIIGSILLLSINSLFAQNVKLASAFSKSYAAEKNKDYDAAIKALTDSYENTSYEENLRLGWLYYKAGKNKESATYYQNAVKLMPYSIEAKTGLIYPVYAQNQMDELENVYKKILEVDPLDVNSNYQLGYIYYNKKNYDLAKKQFEKIINLYPSGYEPYLRDTWQQINKSEKQSDKVIAAFAKSYDFEYKKDYASAITALKDIYDPKYYDVNLRMGWLNYLSGLNKEAIKYYQIAIDLKPNAIEPRFGINYPLGALGNYDDISKQNKKIVEINPQNSYAKYGLGSYYYSKNDYSAAYQYLEKVVNLYPFSYDGLILYAWANYKTGKTAEAKLLFNKVLMLAPGDTSALQGLALIK